MRMSGQTRAARGEGHGDGAVREQVREVDAGEPKLSQPPLYKVVLVNDDYTPMDFVVDVLCTFFHLDIEKATQVMLKVHTEGKGVCGVYSKDIAETKAAKVNKYARESQHPLLCSVEADR